MASMHPAADTEAPAAPTPEASAAGSLWDDLGALNLSAYDDWVVDSDVVDVEGLVAHLCSQADADSMHGVLQQLASPQTSPYIILGCDQWPQLAQLLPELLSSSDQQIAAAAEELLQQQLAPELLHCSPEPLAQLLTALLLPPPPQQGLLVTATEPPATTGAPSPAASTPIATCAQAGGSVYSCTVLQFITAGLQKLGRQWHFIDEPLAAALCTAVVTLVLHALQQQDLAPAAAPADHTRLSQEAQPAGAPCNHQQDQHQQHQHLQQQQILQQQQQPHPHPLALDLLLADPDLSWWHRLHANSASSMTLKAHEQQQGLVQQLLAWAQHCCCKAKDSPRGLSSSSASEGGGTVLDDLGLRSSSSSSVGSSLLLLQHCLAVHCLSVLVGTPSGRQLLQAVVPQSSCVQLHQQETDTPQQPDVPVQQTYTAAEVQGQEGGSLHVCCDCLRLWASLQGTCVQGEQEEQPQGQGEQQQQGGHGHCPSSPQPFPPWGPVRQAAGSAPRPRPQPGGQPSCSTAVEAPRDAVVEAAAATAAWALRAYDEQKPWFGNIP